METLKITMFGEFSIAYGDNIITEQSKRSKKMWTLLQFLIANHNRDISQAELIDLLWGARAGDNPVGALKTSLHRLRACLSALGLPEGEEIIVNKMGSYAFNNALNASIDFDDFELYYKKSLNAQSEKERTTLSMKAIELYDGDFLPKSSEVEWIAPLTAYYHSLFLKIVRETLETLYRHRYYTEILDISRRALTVEKLDDKIHYYYVLALAESGEKAKAKEHYAYVMDLFYNKNAINPSPDFIALYEQTVKDDRAYSTDFAILKGQLDDQRGEPGTFYCEFPFFKHVYQLEVRDAERSGRLTSLCLLTAVSPDQEDLEPKRLEKVMTKLSECIRTSLRSRDVYSRYSVSQFVMLLTNTTNEQAEMILNRILKRFKKENPRLACTLLYRFDRVGRDGERSGSFYGV
ncbi:MAG: diguanylate cyclase [Bacteroides sp.]|nr:diguanylate cyclase [Eubacterium sp.]MCM1419243.1 diguanylate cyclase [Roseburia sp.]MCM1463083.1 diguanylate cyclase [Bacteroides sp.]